MGAIMSCRKIVWPPKSNEQNHNTREDEKEEKTITPAVKHKYRTERNDHELRNIHESSNNINNNE